MWAFLKTFLASLLALFAFLFIGILVLAGIVAGINSKDVTPLKNKSILKLTFDKPILEREYENPFADLNLPVSGESQHGLLEIRKTIAAAKKDDNIKGIYLNLTSLHAGFATVEEVRNILADFKTSGKFIYAYSEYLSEGGYYLASVADSIYLNPSGLLEFNGLSSEITFFKGTLEKLDLHPEIFKVGDYKSAIEPLLLDKMSPASREQTLSFLTSIQHTIYSRIAESRKLSFEKVSHISDSMLIRKTADAVKYGLADKVLYYDQVEEILRRKLGEDKESDLHFVSYRKYADRQDTNEDKAAGKPSENKIAVILAQGDIQSGRGDDETIGSDRIAEELRNARRDKEVKAIVLRINSPGGSSMASDVMWREVQLASQEKPVIASMGDVAASGGYYIAMAADTIVAQPHTITGSIGVFGVLLDAQSFFKNKLGVTFDGVKTGKFSDIGTISRPLNDYERTVIQAEVNDIYTDFVTKAAQGRKMSYEDLARVASGRVWTGLQAKEKGLVDVIGDFDNAVKIAANSARVGENYELVYMPKKRDFFDRLFSDTKETLSGMLASSSPAMALDKVYKQLVNKYNGVQARLPFDIKFE